MLNYDGGRGGMCSREYTPGGNLFIYLFFWGGGGGGGGGEIRAIPMLFHQKIKPRSCRRPLIMDSRWENNKNGREYWVGTQVWD